MARCPHPALIEIGPIADGRILRVCADCDQPLFTQATTEAPVPVSPAQVVGAAAIVAVVQAAAPSTVLDAVTDAVDAALAPASPRQSAPTHTRLVNNLRTYDWPSRAAEDLAGIWLLVQGTPPATTPDECRSCQGRGWWETTDEGGAFDGHETCEDCPRYAAALADARRLVAAAGFEAVRAMSNQIWIHPRDILADSQILLGLAVDTALDDEHESEARRG